MGLSVHPQGCFHPLFCCIQIYSSDTRCADQSTATAPGTCPILSGLTNGQTRILTRLSLQILKADNLTFSFVLFYL